MAYGPAWYSYTYLATHAVVQLSQLHTIHTELHNKSIIHENRHVSVCIGAVAVVRAEDERRMRR